MKKTLLLFLLLIAALLYGKENFADANAITASKELDKEKILIEDLFKTRAEIWNKVYDHSSKLEDFEEALKGIEEDPLLTHDLNTILDLKRMPTDMDKVLSVVVLDIRDISYGRTSMNATVKINWKMQGKDSYYYEEIDYYVILVLSEEGRWKLSDYSITQ